MTTAAVLSGGASGGAVQVGMLRALFEAGIEFDFLVGSSVGAVNASWFAAHPGLEGIDGLERVWLQLRRQDVFPTNALRTVLAASGRRSSLAGDHGLRLLLQRNLTFNRLEDAPIPLHVAVTEVQTGEDILLSSGPAIPALLATTAIPGVLPPVRIDGIWYMDGGVVDNTPISHAVRLGADTVWVLPSGVPCALPSPPSTAAGMALHGLTLLVRSGLIADIARFKQSVDLRGVDLHVVRPVCPLAVAAGDFSQARQLIRRGYDVARGWLAEGLPDRTASLVAHRHVDPEGEPSGEWPNRDVALLRHDKERKP